jgi:hypothetical protein
MKTLYLLGATATSYPDGYPEDYDYGLAIYENKDTAELYQGAIKTELDRLSSDRDIKVDNYHSLLSEIVTNHDDYNDDVSYYVYVSSYDLNKSTPEEAKKDLFIERI